VRKVFSDGAETVMRVGCRFARWEMIVWTTGSHTTHSTA